jgi:hypothetical protein
MKDKLSVFTILSLLTAGIVSATPTNPAVGVPEIPRSNAGLKASQTLDISYRLTPLNLLTPKSEEDRQTPVAQQDPKPAPTPPPPPPNSLASEHGSIWVAQQDPKPAPTPPPPPPNSLASEHGSTLVAQQDPKPAPTPPPPPPNSFASYQD